METSARLRWPIYFGCGCGLFLGCLGVLGGVGYASVERFGLTFGAAMRNVCYASEVVTDGDPVVRAQKIAVYLDDRVVNPQVRAMMLTMGSLGPEEKRRIMLAAAGEAGLERCPITEVY